LYISEILAAKKKAYSDMARNINQVKLDIDNSRLKLDRLKEEREDNGTYIGGAIMDSWIFTVKYFSSII
jgi:hypothetical protein